VLRLCAPPWAPNGASITVLPSRSLVTLYKNGRSRASFPDVCNIHLSC
jgi:hypothetical protein